MLILSLYIYEMGLFAFIIASWIKHPVAKTVHDFLANFYQPILKPIQKVIKPVNIGRSQVDLSPAILLIAIYVLQWIIGPV